MRLDLKLLVKLVYYSNLLCFTMFLLLFMIDLSNKDTASMTTDFYWMVGNTFFVLAASYIEKRQQHRK
jgi:hypothetical protein